MNHGIRSSFQVVFVCAHQPTNCCCFHFQRKKSITGRCFVLQKKKDKRGIRSTLYSRMVVSSLIKTSTISSSNSSLFNSSVSRSVEARGKSQLVNTIEEIQKKNMQQSIEGLKGDTHYNAMSYG